MDDTEQYAIFPLGKGDMEIRVRRPSGGQALAILPLRRNMTDDEALGATRRLMLTMKRLAGDEQWDEIADALALEEISERDLIDFAGEVVRYRGWDDAGATSEPSAPAEATDVRRIPRRA